MKDLLELRVLWPGFVARAEEDVRKEMMEELLGKKGPPTEVSLAVQMVIRSDPWRPLDVLRVARDPSWMSFNYPFQRMSCKCGHIPAKVLKIEGDRYYVEITEAEPPLKTWVTKDQLGHSP